MTRRRRNARPLPPAASRSSSVTITARELKPAPAVTVSEPDAMRVDVLAVPWNTPSRMLREGYREVFAPGSVTADQLRGLPVIDGHTGQAVGIVENARATPAGMVATMRLSATGLARDLHTLATDGALGASLGFDYVADGQTLRGGIVTRTAVTPRELSLTPLPAYEDARVLATREAPAMPDYTFTDPSAVTVTSDAEPTAPDAAPAEDAGMSSAPAETRTARPSSSRPAAPRVEYVTPAELEAQLARLDATRSTAPASAGRGPLSRFASFGEYAVAAFRGDVTPEETRALTDQITSANPGVMPPSWVNDVKGIVARSRSLIEGTGGALSPGESGLSVEWPYYDGDLSTLVGVQATQKTQVTSVAVSIKKGTASLATYAGGSDLAYQLIERSSPSYLDAYLRIMAAAYGVVTENAFGAALGAIGAGTPSTAATFYTDVIGAAAEVADATGNAPSVIGIAADIWPAIAGAVDSDGRPIFPPLGPTNAPGAPVGAGAVSGISVAGIPAVRSLGVPAGNVVITNGEAARFMEDGPRTVTAENVALLGRDVAVYGYAVPAVFIPAGVQRLTYTPAP